MDQETLLDKDSDNELDPVPIEKTDNKILIVYQSKDMQRLYQRYGKHSVLLPAIWETLSAS